MIYLYLGAAIFRGNQIRSFEGYAWIIYCMFVQFCTEFGEIGIN